MGFNSGFKGLSNATNVRQIVLFSYLSQVNPQPAVVGIQNIRAWLLENVLFEQKT